MNSLIEKEVAVTDPVVDQMATISENEVTNPTNTCEEAAEEIHLVTNERLLGVFESADDDDESEEERRTFKTISRSLEVIPIDSIQHFNDLPDFVTPTMSDHPIIIKTDRGYFCIDGWELIETARSEGCITILCEVDELNNHSYEELCLRKGGIRSLTRGGISTYTEMMRNTRDLLAMLLSSDEDLHIFGHGERRYGAGFVNNREEDVRQILSIRLGKDRDTINQYLCHGEYLSSELLQTFIDRKAPKEFFVKAQVKKRIEVKNQQGRNLSNGRITAAISPLMLEYFESFLAAKEAARSGRPIVQTPEIAIETQPSVDNNTPAGDNAVDDEDTNDEFTTTVGNTADFTPEINPEEPVTPEKIFIRYDGVSKRMGQDITHKISLSEMEKRIKIELCNMMALLNMIQSLNTVEKQ